MTIEYRRKRNVGGRVPADLGPSGFDPNETLADHVSGENNTTEHLIVFGRLSV